MPERAQGTFAIAGAKKPQSRRWRFAAREPRPTSDDSLDQTAHSGFVRPTRVLGDERRKHAQSMIRRFRLVRIQGDVSTSERSRQICQDILLPRCRSTDKLSSLL